MMRHNLFTAIVSLLLASVLSIAAAMCPATGFDLIPEHPGALIAVCCTVSLAGSILFQLPRGKGIFLLLSAIPGTLLLIREQSMSQCVFLIQYLSRIYGNAYQWPDFTPNPVFQSIDCPLMLLGYLSATAVSFWVCQGKGLAGALGFSLFPLLLCLVVTDTLPDVLFLFLILTGCAIIVLTAAVRRQSISQANRLTLSALPAIAAALALIFALLPRSGYEQPTQLLRQQIFTWAYRLPGQLDTGLSTLSAALKSAGTKTVRLSKLRRQKPSSAPVMTVTTGHSGVLYLRGQDYDQYSGTGWTASGQRTEHYSPEASNGSTVTIHTRKIADILYIPCCTSEFTLIDGCVPNSENLQQYLFSVSSVPDTGYSGSGVDISQYLALPETTCSSAQTLLDTVCPGYDDSGHTAGAIAAYVQSSAAYSLEPAVMPQGETDFALWFLTKADSGYCAHFATAAVVLLRSAGIPARYVTGYMTSVKAGVPTTVTDADAHAWAEYQDPQTGLWKILETTPPDMTEAETAPSPGSEELLPPSTADSKSHDSAADAERQSSHPSGNPEFLILGFVFPGMVSAQRMIRLYLRKRRQSRGSANQQALTRWEEAELLSRLLRQVPTEETLFLAQKAGFSHHQLTAAELEQLDSYLRFCRQQLRQKHWYIRLIHKYIFAAY